MALGLLTQGASSTNTSNVTAVITPTAGSTLLVFHGCIVNAGGAPTFTVSDSSSATWTKAVENLNPSGTHQSAVGWYANNMSGLPIRITLGTTATGDQVAWQVVELPANITRLGATGSTIKLTAPDLTDLNATLSATPLTTSYVFSCSFVDGSTSGTYATTVGSGYTTLTTLTSTAFATGSNVEYRTGSTSTSAGWVDVQTGTMVLFSGVGLHVEFQLTGGDAGFADITTPATVNPFTSGDQIGYTVQSALTNGVQYFWRVRGKDPAGSGAFGAYATTRSFTVSTGGGVTNTGGTMPMMGI